MSNIMEEEVVSTSVATATSGVGAVTLIPVDQQHTRRARSRSRSSSLRLSREEGSMSSSNGMDGPMDDTDLNLPPGRMNAVKGTHRLQGSGSNLMTLLQQKSGNETPRSRSRSPSIRDSSAKAIAGSGGFTGGYSTSITQDGNSSISSCDDIAPDSDILTDRAGFADELAENIRRMHSSREQLNLPPTVNERMTEESLDDVHAFSDCQFRTSTRSSNASLVSGVSSVANEASVLEPCLEGEEDDSDYTDNEDDDDDNDTGNGGGVAAKMERKHRKKSSSSEEHPTIILTNMENLNLHHQQILEEQEDDDDNDNDDDGSAIVQTASSTQGVSDF